MAKPLILVVMCLIILLQMTTDFYIPAMPEIGHFFKTTNSLIQLSFSFFVFGMALSHLVFAPASDKYGRKLPMISGVFISIIGSIVCICAKSPIIFIAGRFLQGLGIGCCNSVGRSIVRDVFHAEQLAKIGSIVGMLSIVMMVGAPVLGGYVVQHFGWHMNFIIIAITGIIVLIIMIIILPETNHHLNQYATNPTYLYHKIIQLIKNKMFLHYTLASCFASGGLIAWFTISSLVLKQMFHLSPVEIGMQNLYIACAVFLSGLINLVLIKAVGIKKMVHLGTLFMISSGVLMLTFQITDITLWQLMISMSLFATGCGLVFINAFAGAFEPVARSAGIAGMTYALFQDGFASLTSQLIAQDGLNNILCLSVIITSLGVIAFFMVIKIPGHLTQLDSPYNQELLCQK